MSRIVDETLRLLEAGEAAASIADHLRRRPDSIARALYRAKYPVLARLFWTEANRQRTRSTA